MRIDDQTEKLRKEKAKKTVTKAKLNKAVNALKQLLKDQKQKAIQAYLESFDSHGSHRTLAMESHQKTTADTNTNPPTKNWRGRMGKKWNAKGKCTGISLWKCL